MGFLNSLRARIIALVIVFCVLVSAIFVAVLNRAYIGYYDELRQRQGIEFARNVAQMYPQFGQFETLDRGDIEGMFEKMLLLDPRSAIYLLDASGRVRAGYTKERSIGSKSSVSLEPVRRLLAAPIGETVYGDDPDFAGKPSLFAAAPFVVSADAGAQGGAPTGYVYVLMRPPDMDVTVRLMSSYTNRSAFAVAIGGALASALLIFAVLFLITRPLRRLTDAADAVSATARDDVLDPESFPHDPYELRNDEIGRLARAFRAMVTRLRVQMQRVRRMDTTRREWIANVSHDLRTPLTSLIGHLEMVQLRGDRLSEAERARFLDVVMKNAQHLDRLSSSLFDLARLDSDDIPLDKSPAHLGELLDDLVTRFVPLAEARGVTLQVEYAAGLPLVAVDAALIERAVVNLIDNALRYTPTGGAITLSATAVDQAVVLRVADTGCGIAPEAIDHVFERFYQGSQHREGRGHAGLGLALVHRVAELHGGSVEAANRDSGGAVFTMRLPLV
jgi:two-component system, OmpR family, sensor kinase